MFKNSYNKKSKRGKYTVIVLNDKRNTFNHVTRCLQEVCGHNYLQAIQCTNIIHNSGQCEVYTDKYEICIEVYDDLLYEGLTATIVK